MNFLFSKHDFTIVDRYVEYYVDHTKEYETSDAFWLCEHEQIELSTSTYLARVGMNEIIPSPPDAVNKLIIRVKFWYRLYMATQKNENHEFPYTFIECAVVRYG
jgi:hypothetical protein